MELRVSRKIFNEECTIGELFINGNFFCYTLEDKDRGLVSSESLLITKAKKIWGKTAIPKGTYNVILNYSNRFKTYLPLLINVPAFEGVRIHSGNFSTHTEGCILVGYQKETNSIHESKKATKDLIALLSAVEKTEKITITIA